MINYIERTRQFYGALGYPPYQWAKADHVPFSAPAKKLAKGRVVLLSTAAPFVPNRGDQGPSAAYNAATKFFTVYRTPIKPIPDLRIAHLSYDRDHCQADDANTWLPIAALERAKADGVIESIADDLIGIPTNRSQRVSKDQDAPVALEHCLALGADVALLVPT